MNKLCNRCPNQAQCNGTCDGEVVKINGQWTWITANEVARLNAKMKWSLWIGFRETRINGSVFKRKASTNR